MSTGAGEILTLMRERVDFSTGRQTNSMPF